jgi:hypothetical protein
VSNALYNIGATGTVTFTNTLGDAVLLLKQGGTNWVWKAGGIGTLSAHPLRFLMSDVPVWQINTDGSFGPESDSFYAIGSATVRPSFVYSDDINSIQGTLGLLSISNNIILPKKTADPSSDGFNLDTNGAPAPVLKFYYGGTVFTVPGATNTPSDGDVLKYDGTAGRFAFEPETGGGGVGNNLTNHVQWGSVDRPDGFVPIGDTIYNSTNAFWRTNLTANDVAITVNMGVDAVTNKFMTILVDPGAGFTNTTFGPSILWDDGTTTQPILVSNAISYVTFWINDNGHTNGSVHGPGLRIDYHANYNATTNPWNATVTVPLLSTLDYRDFDAAAFLTNATDGASYGTREQLPHRMAYDYLAYADSGSNSAQVKFLLPEDWVGGDIKFKVAWTSTNNAAAMTNVWGLSLISMVNTDSLTNTAFGTEVKVVDDVTAANDYLLSPTATVNPSGSPDATAMYWLRVRRLTDDANHTLGGDARILKVWMQYNRYTSAPAAW